jgi:hypothetical protein
MSTSFENNDFCFACGSKNPLGLRLTFFTAGSATGAAQLCTLVTPGAHWQGFKGVVHGGLQSTIIDDLMSNHLFRLEGVWAATAELTLRFKRPVPMDAQLLFSSQVESRQGRVWNMQAWCRLAAAPAGAALTTGAARFVEVQR